MKNILCLCLLLSTSLFADAFLPTTSPRFDVAIDRSSASFEMRKKKRVDVFDFSGAFPNLENIDIDAIRKKRVELFLTGDYPSLTMVNYEGSFGSLRGELTGHFPLLTQVNFICGSCAMNFDLDAEWEQDCEINIRGMKEDVVLHLPKDVGLVIRTKSGIRGKVRVGEGLKKKGWLGFRNKTYRNRLIDTAPITLYINIETTDGNITLN